MYPPLTHVQQRHLLLVGVVLEAADGVVVQVHAGGGDGVMGAEVGGLPVHVADDEPFRRQARPKAELQGGQGILPPLRVEHQRHPAAHRRPGGRPQQNGVPALGAFGRNGGLYQARPKGRRLRRAAVRLGPPGEHALQQLTAVEVVQALLIQAVDPAVRRVKAQQMVAGRGRHRHAALPRQRAEALCIPSCGHGLGVRQEASPRRPVGAQLLQ